MLTFCLKCADFLFQVCVPSGPPYSRDRATTQKFKESEYRIHREGKGLWSSDQTCSNHHATYVDYALTNA